MKLTVKTNEGQLVLSKKAALILTWGLIVSAVLGFFALTYAVGGLHLVLAWIALVAAIVAMFGLIMLCEWIAASFRYDRTKQRNAKIWDD